LLCFNVQISQQHKVMGQVVSDICDDRERYSSRIKRPWIDCFHWLNPLISLSPFRKTEETSPELWSASLSATCPPIRTRCRAARRQPAF